MRSWYVLALLITLAAALPVAAAPMIVNGSFEQGTARISPGGYAGNLTSGITGWTISSGNIDWITTYWTAADGTHSIDMNGNQPGTIRQVVTTIPNQQYLLQFSLASNTDIAANGVTTLRVAAVNQANGATLSSSNYTHTATHNPANPNWIIRQLMFTANSTQTRIEFKSLTTSFFNGYSGPALDNVSLAAVPEPGAVMLFGTLALALPLTYRLRKRRKA